ncbi:hypothetical protein B0H10DRAFT_1977956 [Mycena sp. CBHHK59/15]|nr:hypothetical protein B0H10DRAFT_1977956 [Mycena sp. CBHHK59/15]
MGSYCGWYSWASPSLAVALLQDVSGHRSPSLTWSRNIVKQEQPSLCFLFAKPILLITQDATNSQVTQSALLSSQVYEREPAPLPLLAGPCSPPPHCAVPSPAALRAHAGPAAAVSTPTPHGAHQPVHAATVLAWPALPTATPVRTRAAAQCRLGVL